MSSPSSDHSRIIGLTKNGNPCKLCLARGTFCHLHVDQAPTRNEQYTVPPSFSAFVPVSLSWSSAKDVAASNTNTRSFGITNSGSPCKICIRKERFCHLHVHQAPTRNEQRTVPPSFSAFVPDSLSWSSAKDVAASKTNTTSFGITNSGSPCKICIRKERFCHLHVHQAPTRNEQHTVTEDVRPVSFSPPFAKKGLRATKMPPTSFGITKNGSPCQLCLKIGRVCHLHVHQAPSMKEQHTAPPSFSPPFAKQKVPATKTPATLFGTTKNGTLCKKCIKLDRFCHLHEVQSTDTEDVPASFAPIVREWKGVLAAKTPVTLFGTTNNGTPCKNCLKLDRFCHLHIDQATKKEQRHDGVAPDVTVPMFLSFNEARQGDTSPTESPAARSYNLPREAQPCKNCLLKGTFCASHEHLRTLPPSSRPEMTLGITVRGTACKICLRKGDFCHWHADQKKDAKKSTPSTPFVLTKKGSPCKLCIRKGGICHVHEHHPANKEKWAPTSLGHPLRWALSWVLVGMAIEYALLLGLLGQGVAMTSLQEDIMVRYQDFGLDSLVRQGRQAYEGLQLNSVVERGTHLKEGLLEQEWVHQVRYSRFLQSAMDLVGSGAKALATTTTSFHASQDSYNMNSMNDNQTRFPAVTVQPFPTLN